MHLVCGQLRHRNGVPLCRQVHLNVFDLETSRRLIALLTCLMASNLELYNWIVGTFSKRYPVQRSKSL